MYALLLSLSSWASRAQHSKLSGPETLKHPLLWPAATCDILHYSLVLPHRLGMPGTGVHMGSRVPTLSVLKCAQVLRGGKKAKRNQPQPKYQQLHVNTWQGKLHEIILIILKCHGDNTHRQEEMAQQRPSEVQTRVQSWDNLGPRSDHAHPMTILTSQWWISLVSCLSPISNKHYTFIQQRQWFLEDLQVGCAEYVVFKMKKLYTNTWYLRISQARGWKRMFCLIIKNKPC